MRKHRTIGMSPENLNKDNEKQVARKINQQQYYKMKYSNPKFKLGDVKIGEYKHVFEKGYTLYFSTENFTVSRGHYTGPFTYSLMDYQNESIQEKSYEEELQKTQYPNVYLIDMLLYVIRKVIRYMKMVGIF